jgi:hypothetical protein
MTLLVSKIVHPTGKPVPDHLGRPYVSGHSLFAGFIRRYPCCDAYWPWIPYDMIEIARRKMLGI